MSEIQKLRGSSFFSKRLNFNLDVKTIVKNREKFFSLKDNCILIGIFKLSPVRTGYFLLAINVLTSSPKIFHVYKRHFSQLN